MSDLIIYGASDDLIEVEGLIREELNPPYGKGATITVMVDDARHLSLYADYDAEEANRARLPERVRHKAPRHWWRSLCAFRCHHCQLDTVWDTEADEMWTLDHTDYGDEGSSA